MADPLWHERIPYHTTVGNNDEFLMNKVSLTTDAPQGTIRPITEANALRAEYIHFLPGDTGGVDRPVRTKLAQVVDVRDFGAVGDNSTTDTAAINAAIAAANARSSTNYTVLWFPPCSGYKVTTALTSLATFVSVKMDAPVIFSGTPLSGFLWTIGSTSVSNYSIDHAVSFELWFNRAGTADFSNAAWGGVKLINLCNSFVRAKSFTGFNIGMQVVADSNSAVVRFCSDNIFELGRFGCQHGVDLVTVGTNAACFIGPNAFYGGLFANDAPTTQDRSAVRMRVTASGGTINGPKFYGTDIQLGTSGTNRSDGFRASGAVTMAAYDLNINGLNFLAYSETNQLLGHFDVARCTTPATELAISGTATASYVNLKTDNQATVTGAYTPTRADLNGFKTLRYTGAGHTWTVDNPGLSGSVFVDNAGTGAITFTAGTSSVLAGSLASLAAGRGAMLRFTANGASWRLEPSVEIVTGGGLEYSVGQLQRSAFTGGDVTGSAGSALLSIGAGKVTTAMMANLAASTVLGRDSGGGAGAPQALTLTGGLEFTGGGALSIQRSAFAGGDVTGAAGSATLTIGTGAVTDAKLRTSAARSVIARAGSTSGQVADLSATVNSGAVLVENGAGSLVWGTVATAGIANDAVTLAKLQNAVANQKLLGSGAAGAGVDYVEITLGTNLSMSGTTLNASGGAGGGNVSTSGSPVTGDYARWASGTTIESRTATQVKTDLGLTVGTDVQAFDADLATLAADFVTATASVPASLALREQTTNGTNKLTLTAPASIVTTDKVATFQDVTGTVYVSSGTDVAIADGGTGSSLSDPNADRIMFWDESAGSGGAVDWLTASSGLTISGTSITADVRKTGTPAATNYARWTDANTLEARTAAQVLSDIGAQASDAELSALAGLTSAADAVPYFTGSGTASTTTVTSVARTFLSQTSTANMLSNIGGQPLDADLTTLSTAFTSASASGPASLLLAEDTDNGANTIQLIAPASIASDKVVTFQDITGTVYVSGGTNVAVADGGTGADDAATARTNLGLAIGTNVQAYDAELAALAGLTSAADKVPYFTGSGTAGLADLGSAARTFLTTPTLATLGGMPNTVFPPLKPDFMEPDTSGQVFRNVHVGGTNSRRWAGMGVTDATTLTADRHWYLGWQLPEVLPTSGTLKLKLWAVANATANSAKVNPKWVSMDAEETFDTVTLTAETTQTITWAAGDADQPKELLVTLDADTAVAGEFIYMDLTFEDTSFTLAVVSTWLAWLVWV